MQHQQEYIRTRPWNPFATVSWLYLQLTQHHLFDLSHPLGFPDGSSFTTPWQGGNGQHSDDSINSAGHLDQRAKYYDGIRRVNHSLPITKLPTFMNRVVFRVQTLLEDMLQ